MDSIFDINFRVEMEDWTVFKIISEDKNIFDVYDIVGLVRFLDMVFFKWVI